MSTFRDFVKWYNNKDVVPTLEAMQKMMEFYHNKGIDMLKLGCTLPNLANICLHKSTNHKFFPFVEADKDLHDKIREDMTGGPSIVFTRKAVVDQTFIRNSVPSHFYPFSMCREMPTGLYTRWEFDTDSQSSGLEQTDFEHLRTWLCHIFNHNVPNVKLRATTQPENRRRLIVLA